MSEDYKERARRATEAHYARVEKKNAGPSRRNAKPEKAVQVACMAWMRAEGWDVEVFEAKATWSSRAQAWRQQAMRAGVLDSGGNLPSGIATYVEFKAPGKLYSLRDSQRGFLVRKIASGAFACVVDSVDRLRSIYGVWAHHVGRGDFERAKEFLIGMVPMRRRA